ncbi:MAG: DUF4340 domain-containing protein [Bacteroidales bacterium]|nr:DUF4340 domain-containing protein [Bacteroidales bacterium]
MHSGKILAALLIVLISLAGYYTYRQNRVLESTDFSIKNSKEITEIHFELGEESVVLQKKDTVWLVNNAFPANRNLIKRFFKVFANLNLVAPVSKIREDSIKRLLDNSALKITLYKKSSVQYEYLLGGLNSSKTGNYLLCNEHLGLLNSLGLYKNLRNIVSVNSLFWRNKIILNKPANEIKSIRFKNFQKPEQSFLIDIGKSKFQIFDYKDNMIENYDTNLLQRYLSYFQNISFKEIESKLKENQINYILKNNKAYSIELIDKENISYHLNLYFKPQNLDNFKSKQYDLNLIYGKLNNEKYLLILEYYEIDPILKELSWFLLK